MGNSEGVSDLVVGASDGEVEGASVGELDGMDVG